MSKSALAVLVALGLVGCTRNETVVADMSPPPRRTAEPPPSATAAPAPTPPETAPEPQTPPPPIVIARRPEDAPQLGAACADASTCGTKKRVALRAYRDMTPGLAKGDLPCKPVGTTKPTVMPEAASACVSGDRLYVMSVCVVCRMPSNTRAEAIVSELTPPQREFAQKLAGLSTAGTLASADAWSKAIADAHTTAKVAP